MKFERFLDYMKSSAESWANNPNLQSFHEQYRGFIYTIEMFRSDAKRRDEAVNVIHELLLEFAKGSLRILALINAGGIFVIMTVLSSLISKEGKFYYLIPKVAAQAKYFVTGLSLAAVTILFSYLAQWFYNSFNKDKYGLTINIIAMITGFVSLLMFIYGATELITIFSYESIKPILDQLSNSTN